MNRVAHELPSASWASLYLEYTQFIVRKLRSESTATPPMPSFGQSMAHDGGSSPNIGYQGGLLQVQGNATMLPSVGYWDMEGNVIGPVCMSFGNDFGGDPTGFDMDQEGDQFGFL